MKMLFIFLMMINYMKLQKIVKIIAVKIKLIIPIIKLIINNKMHYQYILNVRNNLVDQIIKNNQKK